jgi:putative ABC transport system permease protein
MNSLMEIFGQTLRTLWAHKLRSFLTMFGIAWGVGSLLLLVGVGEGFRSGQKRQMANLGTDVIMLWGGRVPAVEGSFQAGRRFRVTYEDYLAIQREARTVRRISPVLNRSDIRAQSDHESTNGQVWGVAPEFNDIRTVPVARGRWLNPMDEAEGRQVVVLGSEMRKNMFKEEEAVGRFILLNGARFRVIGVLEQVGREGQGGTNMRIYVPIRTMRTMFPIPNAAQRDAISAINYQPLTRDTHVQTREEVRAILARRYGFDPAAPDAFDEWDTIEGAKRVGLIFDAMNWFLGGVGLLTLALGAVGVINIMLVSVSERTREIGLRKAVGATNRTILTQFFAEGAFLTLLSGAIGLAAAAGFMGLLGMLPPPPGFDTPKVVPLSAALAITALSLAGIVAGLYPARRASLLTPVEALRKE